MLNFDNYINEFNGKAIQSEDEFDRLLKKSLRYINSFVSADYTDNDISQAAYALCDILAENEFGNGIKTEKADGVSVTYEDNRLDKIICSTLRLYLPPRLLYLGLS